MDDHRDCSPLFILPIGKRATDVPQANIYVPLLHHEIFPNALSKKPQLFVP
jgi:hypothetical protein